MVSNHFSRIKYKSRPHDIFKLDWRSYDTGKFGDSFLPHSDYCNSDSIKLFDAAELFAYQSIQTDLIYDLWINEQLPEITIYTFADGTMASKNWDRISLRPNEIVVTMTVTESKKVKTKILYGVDIKQFLDQLWMKTKKIYEKNQRIEDVIFNTSEIQSIFGNTFGHKAILKSLFNLSGINKETIEDETAAIILNNSSSILSKRRRNKKIIDEKGGHVINTNGEIIWRSKDNPDNGYTWRYTGDLTLKDMNCDELLNLDKLAIITKGEIDQDGRTVMNFIGSDFDYQNLIEEQANLLGINVQIKIRPADADNYAFVSKGYHNTDKQKYPKQNGWQHGGDMGSIILTNKSEIEFVWNSKRGNKIGLASVYDIRSILVHEYKHFVVQQELFVTMEEQMRTYVEENEIEFQQGDELETKLKEILNQDEWDDKIARIWFFQIDNNFFLPTAKFSDPFMEVIAYAEQVKHTDYEFCSRQLRVQHVETIFPQNPEDLRTTNYGFQQGYGNDLYEPNSPLTRTDAGLKFWNHKSMDEYKNFIFEQLKPILDFRNQNLKK